MKKLYRIIILSITCLCVFMSCQYNSTKLLNKDELKWLEAYSGKETLLYRSSMHEMDTIVILKINKKRS